MSGTTTLLISGPVLQLQSSTSSRIGGGSLSGSSLNGSQNIYSAVQKNGSQQSLQKDAPVSVEDDVASKYQIKYASPENVIPPNTNNSEDRAYNETNLELGKGSVDELPNIAQMTVSNVEARDAKPPSTLASPAFSDTSSELSDSPFHSGTPPVKQENSFAAPVNQSLTEDDINQAEIFYRSHKTEVRVCRSLANLYVSVAKIKDRASLALVDIVDTDKDKVMKRKPSKKSKSSASESQVQYKPPPRHPEFTDIKKDEWQFCKTGIPVLILDSGDHHRDRRLTIVLAERGTGFTLWSDVLNHLTKYNIPHDNFHTMTISTDSTRLVGLSFDDGAAAAEFGEAVTSLMGDPADSLLNLSKKKSKKKEKTPKTKYKAPRKIDISQPCCFVHVTKLEKPDYLKIPHLVFPPPPAGTELRSSRVNMLHALSDSSGQLSDISTSPSVGK